MIINPLVRWVLRSPLHDLLSQWVALLNVTGRRSGATFVVPVQYAQDGDMLSLVSRRSRQWWRNLESGADVKVTLRGEEHPGRAAVSRDPARVEAIARSVGRDRLQDGVAITIRLAPALVAVTDRRGLWRRWFVAVTLGEMLGFAVPAVVAAVVAGAAWPGPLFQAAIIVMAGTIEGTILGLAQAYVLRNVLPAVGTLDWVKATAGGAAIAWVIGSLPFILGERLMSWHPVLLGALGLTLLGSMGLLQWRVLRRHVRDAGWWVAATAGSWLVALGVFTGVTSPLWQEGQPGWLVAVIGLLGGAGMAATVAALTGLVLQRLVEGRTW